MESTERTCFGDCGIAPVKSLLQRPLMPPGGKALTVLPGLVHRLESDKRETDDHEATDEDKEARKVAVRHPPACSRHVNAAFAEWGLKPLVRRETSARRECRQKQFGSIALGGYLSGRVLDVLAGQTNAAWPQVLLLPAMVMTFGGGLALLWSMAWRFVDERPA